MTKHKHSSERHAGGSRFRSIVRQAVDKYAPESESFIGSGEIHP